MEDIVEIRQATAAGHLEEAVAAGEGLIARADAAGIPAWGRQFASAQGMWPLLWLGRGKEAMTALPQAALLAGVEQPPNRAGNSAVCLGVRRGNTYGISVSGG